MKDFNQNRSDRKSRSCETGFSLLEVLVAMAILTFGLLAVASMQVSSMRGNAFAGAVTGGSAWAADRIEKLSTLAQTDYGNPDLEDSDGDGVGGLNDIQADADHSVSQGAYTICWNVANNDVIDDTKTIRVIVIWTDHGLQKRVVVEKVVPRFV